MTASLDHEHRAALCLVLTVCGAYPSLSHPGGDRVPSQHFVPHIFFGLDPMMVSTVILCTTYGVIIWDKLNRAIVALLGASVMVIGASANLTVAGIAERNGVPFRFMTYAFYGMPMMIVSIAIAHLYVWWRYF